MKDFLEIFRLIIQFLAQLSALLLAINKTASKVKSIFHRFKPKKAKTQAASESGISNQETAKQNKRPTWIRASCSFIALTVLIFFQVTPLRKESLTLGDAAFITMVGGLFVVAMLDRP